MFNAALNPKACINCGKLFYNTGSYCSIYCSATDFFYFKNKTFKPSFVYMPYVPIQTSKIDMSYDLFAVFV